MVPVARTLSLLLTFFLCACAETPPRFTRTPVDQTGVSGGVASFICQATGDPRPKIVWNKKGKKVSNQRFEVIEFDDGSGSVLRIQPLRTPRDEAIYECVASNNVGEISVSTRLTVLREDQIPRGFPTIDMGPQLKVVERTRTATMLCAASGNPDPEITWFKDFLPVDTSNNNGRIKQLRSGALQIEQSEESDQGKYECVATNSAGTRYSAPANLYVRVRRVPPRFSIPPTNHEIMPGGSVNITCVAVGSPMPYVKWMLGAEDLTPEDDMPIGRNVLELNDVRQSANYTCVAMSTLGVIEAIAQITVKALPKPPGTPVVTESTATSITLTWDSGNPEPVSYYIIQHKPKNSEEPYKEIDGIATTRYSVAGLSPYSDYEFRVVAVNNIGRGPPSEPVLTQTSEQAPSSAPRDVQARMLSSTTILVQWKEPEEPNGQIQGYRVYYTMDPTQHVNNWMKHNVADSQITTIGNLVPQKTYSVKVLAFTSIGDGPLSSDIQVITQTGVPGQPLNFKAEPESETSILLSWTPPRSDTIASYELVYRDGEQGEEQRITIEPGTSYRLQGLKPNSLYYFRLSARSPQGLGASTAEISARTMQSRDVAPPQDISCTSPSSTSILVSWQPPPVEKQNGIITGYSLKYAAVNGEDYKPHEVLRIPSDTTKYLLEQLEKWTEYRITVTAHTDVGPGPESLSVLIRTDEDVPSGPPRKVEVEAVNATAVKVSWRSPVPNKQHGQIRGYQVHYVRMENGEPKGQPMLKDVMLADAQDMIISGLQPETSYSLTVTAYTTKGDGARSKPKLVSTTGAVPGRPRLVINHTQMNTALIQWHPPVDTFGPLQGYRLKFGRKDMEPLTTLEFSEKEDHFTATDIHKGASYVFRLSARNKVGFGEEMVKEISVPEEIPTGFPQNLHSEGTTSTSVQLSWQPPVLAERNGVITKYTILYRDINIPLLPMEHIIVPADTSMTLTGLKSDTTYDVKVRAHTSKGPGPYSPSVQFRTLPVDQVFAKNFHVKAVMKTSVLLSWEIPENYNSAMPFKILYDDGKMVEEVDGRATQKLIVNLKPEKSYSFVLTNRGNSAGGLQHRVTAKTAPDVLRTKPAFIGKTNLDGMITVQLPDVPANENIKGYYIIIVPLKKSRGKFIKPWESPDEMELDELLKEISRKRRSIRYGREVELKPYIAAHFDVLPTEFTLGDDKHYGGFTNKQLQSGQEYVFFVLAVMDHAESKMYATSPYSDPVVSMDLDPQPITDEEEGLIWVVGPVLAVVFIICIVIAILLYKRKRAEAESRKSSLPNSKEVPSHHPTDPVELRRLNFQTPGMASHPPIPILELADHIERLKANDNLKFSQEYESIDPGQQFTWEHSNLEVNKPKNRYANVIAYDHSRVLLSAIEGIPGSDYVNANYIDGYRKQNAYIATQGSLPETFGDFWRMIWEQRSATVVMMTKLEERSRVKCDQYWPSRGTETHGLVQVTLLDTVELATYCVRTFALYKNGSSEKREVRQFQFTAWPDHGVPEHPTPFLAFLRRVKTCNPPDAGPMVVHCSLLILVDDVLKKCPCSSQISLSELRSINHHLESPSFVLKKLLLPCGKRRPPGHVPAHIHTHTHKHTHTKVEGENVLPFLKRLKPRKKINRQLRLNNKLNKQKQIHMNVLGIEALKIYFHVMKDCASRVYIIAVFALNMRIPIVFSSNQIKTISDIKNHVRNYCDKSSILVVQTNMPQECGRLLCQLGGFWPDSSTRETDLSYQSKICHLVGRGKNYKKPRRINLIKELNSQPALGRHRHVDHYEFEEWLPPDQPLPSPPVRKAFLSSYVFSSQASFVRDLPLNFTLKVRVAKFQEKFTYTIISKKMVYNSPVWTFSSIINMRGYESPSINSLHNWHSAFEILISQAVLSWVGIFS
ncbi:receptor-type tyrosine-protein phosphatase delta isoform X18, partial [Sigmodon hispidus]